MAEFFAPQETTLKDRLQSVRFIGTFAKKWARLATLPCLGLSGGGEVEVFGGSDGGFWEGFALFQAVVDLVADD